MKSAVLGLTCAAAFASLASAENPVTAKATFIDTEGREIGTATLTETLHGVLISATVQVGSAGEHAFHIHEKGVCNPADGFKSAGGHFNPFAKKHGFKAEGGPHAGDMPNQVAGADGVLRANVINTMVTLKDGKGTLFGPDGTSLVIHDGPDDYESQPSGAAGARIACAVIKR